MSREEKLAEFVGWAQHHISGDEKGQTQIFLDRLFQAFGLPGVLDVGGQTEFRIRQAAEDGGGTAFADPNWNPEDLPGANPLKDAHAALDAAVLAAYGFSAKKDLLAQLLALNLEVARRIEKGEPVTPPGIPARFPNPETLTSGDCIHPLARA
jgi:hypothetical protein